MAVHALLPARSLARVRHVSLAAPRRAQGSCFVSPRPARVQLCAADYSTGLLDSFIHAPVLSYERGVFAHVCWCFGAETPLERLTMRCGSGSSSGRRKMQAARASICSTVHAHQRLVCSSCLRVRIHKHERQCNLVGGTILSSIAGSSTLVFPVEMLALLHLRVQRHSSLPSPVLVSQPSQLMAGYKVVAKLSGVAGAAGGSDQGEASHLVDVKVPLAFGLRNLCLELLLSHL